MMFLSFVQMWDGECKTHRWLAEVESKPLVSEVLLEVRTSDKLFHYHRGSIFLKAGAYKTDQIGMLSNPREN